MNLAYLIPEAVIDYMLEFLCLCQVCFRRVTGDESIRCGECQRYWCNKCRPTDQILKYIYIPEKNEKMYICAWCIRERRAILNTADL